VGFQGASHMNGAVGTLGQLAEARGVWQVFLPTTDKAKAIPPVNLEPILSGCSDDLLLGA